VHYLSNFLTEKNYHKPTLGRSLHQFPCGHTTIIFLDVLTHNINNFFLSKQLPNSIRPQHEPCVNLIIDQFLPCDYFRDLYRLNSAKKITRDPEVMSYFVPKASRHHQTWPRCVSVRPNSHWAHKTPIVNYLIFDLGSL
jgi:hypothetical protein